MTTVFVKGLRSGGTQAREAALADYVTSVSPRLLWRIADVDGWDLLGFEHLQARDADFQPGSPDLPAVLHLARRIGDLTCPDLPEITTVQQRWGAYVDNEADLELFAGSTLLHTDYNPSNILITSEGRAWMVDWAWPARGAGWIDACVLACRLLAAGHSVTSAEARLHDLPSWPTAPLAAVAVFSRAQARMWEEIAREDVHQWKRELACAAHAWADHCGQRAATAGRPGRPGGCPRGL